MSTVNGNAISTAELQQNYSMVSIDNWEKMNQAMKQLLATSNTIFILMTGTILLIFCLLIVQLGVAMFTIKSKKALPEPLSKVIVKSNKRKGSRFSRRSKRSSKKSNNSSVSQEKSENEVPVEESMPSKMATVQLDFNEVDPKSKISTALLSLAQSPSNDLSEKSKIPPTDTIKVSLSSQSPSAAPSEKNTEPTQMSTTFSAIPVSTPLLFVSTKTSTASAVSPAGMTGLSVMKTTKDITPQKSSSTKI